MSRNAFPQLEREYNERLGQREQAAYEREQMAKWTDAYNTGYHKGFKACQDALNRAFLECLIDEWTLAKINEFLDKAEK